MKSLYTESLVKQMGMSMSNKSGFTLIEVLIALAILSIALTAIIKFTSQNIRDTNYLQNKMVATWVGNQVINEIRAGVIKIGQEQQQLDQTTDMLGQSWVWHAQLTPTPSPHIQEIHVDVSQKNHRGKLISMVGYFHA